MQRFAKTESKTILQKLKTAVCILTWAAGLILAGSDGPMMPYINGVGVVLFAGASFRLARTTCQKEAVADTPVNRSWGLSDPVALNRLVPSPSCKEKRPAIRSRYARELGVV